ncbi:rust resistance kinase Lr10-like [Fagus crenata]
MDNSLLLCIFLFCLLLLVNVEEFGAELDECKETRCKHHGPTIRFPFWLKDHHPEHCRYPGFELSCTEDKDTMLELPRAVKLFVKHINYTAQQIHVYDPVGCLPRQIGILNLTASPFQFPDFDASSILFADFLYNYSFFNCSSDKYYPSSDKYYPYEGRVIQCLSNHGYQIVALYEDDPAYYAPLSCPKIYDSISVPFSSIIGYAKDFPLNWSKPICGNCEAEGKKCGMKGNTSETQCSPIKIFKQHTGMNFTHLTLGLIVVLILGSFLLVLVFIALYHFYRSNSLEKESQVKIEKVLEDYKALKPTRYSYADIKRITNQFKDKVGQGGYGTVFKGRLSNDVFVAVKILNNYKGDGEEFINEVGSMGRIRHVNVARLVGYCANGFQRALIYEFLPNESLEKHIFSVDGKNHILGWEKLQDIALGIAKGIEYLHQGCDLQILHFDIKPHNILLDHNFNPKISDFGLAKLCSREKSVVSMTAARGTMGYIAPEVLSRNFGTVSHKSDVYSFGMLLLEIVGGRKNIDTTVENTSQVYFPKWIYNHLDQGENPRIQLEEEGHATLARKLTIVGLWCIQWYPINRPSMKVVVQMLEGEGDNLKIPPNPFDSTHSMNQSLIVLGKRFHTALSVNYESEE